MRVLNPSFIMKFDCHDIHAGETNIVFPHVSEFF